MRPSTIGFTLSLLLHSGLVFSLVWFAQSANPAPGFRPLSISISAFRSADPGTGAINQSSKVAPEPQEELVSTREPDPPENVQEEVTESTSTVAATVEADAAVDDRTIPHESRIEANIESLTDRLEEQTVQPPSDTTTKKETEIVEAISELNKEIEVEPESKARLIAENESLSEAEVESDFEPTSKTTVEADSAVLAEPLPAEQEKENSDPAPKAISAIENEVSVGTSPDSAEKMDVESKPEAVPRVKEVVEPTPEIEPTIQEQGITDKSKEVADQRDAESEADSATETQPAVAEKSLVESQAKQSDGSVNAAGVTTEQPLTIDNNETLQIYRLTVSKKIEEAKFYPRKAKRLRKEGSVTVQFSILKNGQVKDLDVAASSNNRAIDRAALEAVKRSTPFPPFPQGFSRDQLLFSVKLIYQLN